MDPLTMAGISFGLQAIGTGMGFMGQQDQAAQNNKAIKARNQYSMQQYAYGEQMKDFEYRNALKIYDMRKEQFRLQDKEYNNAFAEYYMDEQIAMDDLITQATLAAFQQDMQQDQAIGRSVTTRADRGVGGRRSQRTAQNTLLMAGMASAERARQLALAEERQDMRIDRQAKRTNLMKQMAFNAIGPAPERGPSAPLPYMEQLDQGPSTMGLFSGLLNDAGSAFGTYASLKAPKAGDINTGGTNWNQTPGVNPSIAGPTFQPSTLPNPAAYGY